MRLIRKLNWTIVFETWLAGTIRTWLESWNLSGPYWSSIFKSWHQGTLFKKILCNVMQPIFNRWNGIMSSETYLHECSTCQWPHLHDLLLSTHITGDSYLFRRAPRGRRNRSRSQALHRRRTTSIYYSVSMLVPHASDAKDRNQHSAWSRPF